MLEKIFCYFNLIRIYLDFLMKFLIIIRYQNLNPFKYLINLLYSFLAIIQLYYCSKLEKVITLKNFDLIENSNFDLIENSNFDLVKNQNFVHFINFDQDPENLSFYQIHSVKVESYCFIIFYQNIKFIKKNYLISFIIKLLN